MPWFFVDDKWHSHPKTIGLSLAACGLWSKAGSWAMDNLTDGVVPWAAVKQFGGTQKLAAELVRARLWHVIDGGWQFHDWLAHQRSRARVTAEREATKLRVSGHRNAKVKALHGAGNAVGNADVTPLHGAGNAVGNADVTPLHGACNAVGTAAPSPSPSPSPIPDLNSHTARASDGKSWLAQALGRDDHDLNSWLTEFRQLAARPKRELELVAASLRDDPWVQQNLHKCTPKHVLKYWADYVAGPRVATATKLVPRAASRFASGAVSSAEEHAADAASGRVF